MGMKRRCAGMTTPDLNVMERGGCRQTVNQETPDRTFALAKKINDRSGSLTRRIPLPFLVSIACGLLWLSQAASAQTLGFGSPGLGGNDTRAAKGFPGSAAGPTDVIVANAPSSGSAAATVPTIPAGWARDTNEESVILPKSVPDPIEPFNRALWAFNVGLMKDVVKPTGRAYRAVVRKPIRNGIANFGRNVTYPGRLLNNLLEGKLAGARDETTRFVCNTIVGAGGFIDVAGKQKIPRSDADFGQTFGRWGWKPGCYLMLPVLGPSNDRDLLGFAADEAADPLIYITPYPVVLRDPVTYFSPYTYFSFGVRYNNLSDSVDDYVRLTKSDMDAYSELQYAWTFERETRAPDFHLKGPQDAASLETIELIRFAVKDPEFPNRSRTSSVLIPATGRRLNFTFWLQSGRAPIVYIVPGLGSHRLAAASLALAELVFDHGFSAVCVSSPYNYEFMEHASTAAMPAYTPVDVRDLHVGLTEIDHRLEREYPGRISTKALMGYSMGAFESLFIAGNPATNQPPLLRFDRYVCINPPVRLLYGVAKLDEFYDAPLAWPAPERTADIERIRFWKVAALSRDSSQTGTPPFDAVESKFLIGLTFRFILRDVIYSSQRRHNQGVLKHPIGTARRAPVYREILRYSYKDYFEKFVTPYYQTRGIDLTSPETLARASDLRAYQPGLRANHNIRILTNQDDFLLPDEDLEWLRATFAPEQLTIFERGGHLGNLSHPAVQKAILAAFKDLMPTSGF